VAKFFSSRIVGAERIRTLLKLEESVVARVRAVVEDKAQEVLSRAKARASGQVLRVRKGRLLRSLQMKTYESEAGPGAKVFSRWYIARFYEEGFGGKTVQVKPHTRRVKSRDVRERVQGENGKTRRKRVAQGIGFVKQHDRTIPRVQRPFLRPSLDEMRPSIRRAFAAAVKGA
jgi:hypothetical protein